VLVAPEGPEAVLAAMADPAVRIVTLTVTEKGYCYNPSTGALSTDHPDIQHDLAHDLPVSAPGCLVRALARRRAASVALFTVLTSDNLPENGRLVRGLVLDFAQRIDPALSDWITTEGRTDDAIPFRPDHGHHMLSDLDRDVVPGHPLIFRLCGLAELRGVIRGLGHGRSVGPHSRACPAACLTLVTKSCRMAPAAAVADRWLVTEPRRHAKARKRQLPAGAAKEENLDLQRGISGGGALHHCDVLAVVEDAPPPRR
jgi:hypothetical protein